MLNKLFKKSIATKLFLMNLLILICIVLSQLFFQAIYFEKYYLNKKENILEKNINIFEELLKKETDDKKIIEFIKEVKSNDNVALSIRESNLYEGIGIEAFMGNRYIVTTDSYTGEKYKVILADQFPKVEINKNDFIQVVGSKSEYGYVFAERVFINGIELEPYYNIIPSTITNAAVLQKSTDASISSGEGIYVNGNVEALVKEDSSYSILSNAELYLTSNEKDNILNNISYNGKFENNINVDDILFNTKSFEDKYIIAITPITEVNEVIGTMNSYYVMIFFIALILVVAISFIYSKLMTRPLVEMSTVAKRISESDFQYKYKVNSEDEIGILGHSLNLISVNLEKSLNELQEANIQLKDKMEVQKLQEEKRKELIANISHELKTPITIIQGSINGIKSGMYTTDMYEDILEETHKLNDLVKEMLEMSKLEATNFKLSNSPFDLYSIVLKEQDKLKSMIKEKNLKVIIKGEDEAIVFGDEKRINQVITNLFTNAIKYSKDNNKIEIVIDFIEDQNKYVFKIKNYGASLSKEEQEKIWDSFYRTEKSRNKKFGGTGLGLAIVKRILELHKSEYGVNSDEESVEFYFSISRCMGY